MNAKRLFDLAVAVLSAPLWVPLLLFAAAAIVVVDGRPVFFRQERSGRGGAPFSILKLRTMREGEGSDAERTTRLGRFLRATSLDELPQLLHVLSGKMSLVGPRPLPVRYLPRYNALQKRRLEVRPGITGLAQVAGRNALSWERRLRLDAWYARNVSFALDMKILLATAAAVFLRKGVDAAPGVTMEEFRGSAPRAS